MRTLSARALFVGLLLSAVSGALALAGDQPAPSVREAPRSEESLAADARFFETNIRPLLVSRCQSCHGSERQSGGLRVDSVAALRKGGVSGPALIPGRPADSLLLQAVGYQHRTLRMPPGGKLPARQLADLARWVAAGARWPTSVAGPQAVDPRRHWSFQPVVRPALPRVKQAGWVKSPVDAFILARLERQGLTPAPPADRRTLLRRATFDLTGLPPTPEEQTAFLADRSPNAFGRVVDRLLASTAYGERWGRHWLDVARYADSNGLDENVAHGNAWRYRDWVIRCFNEDKPYDEFVAEQLAGDLMPSEDRATRHGRLTATGFLSLGPKVLAEADKEKMVMDIVDEQIDTVGKAFMGLTLGCARCHNHKFDPIPTADYYALAGIFKSTRTMESLVTIARWWENSIATPDEIARKAESDRQIAEMNGKIAALVERGKQELMAAGAPLPLPKEPEAAFSPALRAELTELRERLARLQKEAPDLPTAMGVTEAAPVDVPIHIRGEHVNLGAVVARGFPAILVGGSQPALPPDQSGRLQLARWLTSPAHPLTGRVLVNRVWRWHYGRGLSPSTDNFGLLGEKPSHPELLDWLAATFTAPSTDAGGLGWSLKRLHRLLMLSSTYQMASGVPASGAPRGVDPNALDPENRLHSRASPRRLEAEEVRDSLLDVAGLLDRSMGGSLLHVKNREFFFDHTSKDGTKYTSRRRAVYLPVVRNNVYDVFQLFDFADPAVLESNRPVTTVAPQALFWMNSDLVLDAAEALAGRLLSSLDADDARIRRAHLVLYGRPASDAEVQRGIDALRRLQSVGAAAGPARAREQAWAWYCQSLLAANEFIYLR